MTTCTRVLISIAIILTMSLAVSCKKEEAPVNPSVDVATTTVNSIVQVDFSGLIAQLAKQDVSTTKVPRRAVVLKDNSGHHEHEFMIQLPEIKATEKELEIIGTTVKCDTNKKAGCEITDINDGITLSIAGMEPSPLKTTLTFDTLVPSLGEANGTAIPATAIHAELKTAAPTTGGRFLAFFDFTGGELSAVGFCGRGAFKKAKTEEEVQRRFAEVVTLLGTTTTFAKLTVFNSKLNKTVTFEFTHPDYVHIKLLNFPVSSGSDHFPLYNYLFDPSAGIALPEINTDEGCKGKGTVVGCSDSQWP